VADHNPDFETTVRAPPKAGAGGGRVLVVMHGERYSHHELPASGTLSLGRASWSDIQIDEPSISRDHLVLHLGSAIGVKDLGSANGTTLRGARMPKNEVVDIGANEVFVAGDVALVVQRKVALPATVDRVDDESEVVEAGTRIVRDPAMIHLYDLAARVAKGTINVLIVGETGVGKEILAEHIHTSSPRAAGPFIKINCAAVAEHLFESELFGHEKGAFTGADKAKPGLIEAANGGTLMFDEVGEMPVAVQSKLLRVIEDGSVQRVGAVAPRPIDARFLAATNRDLERSIERGDLREDLYYRLAGMVLEIPALRDRQADIEPLARSLLAAACERQGRPPPALTPGALAALRNHAWPGNIRELRNVVDRAALLCQGAAITEDDLPLKARRPAPIATEPGVTSDDQTDEVPARGDLASEIAELEKRRITEALESTGGNQTRAAELLGMPRRTLVKRIKQYGIRRPRE
jgi:DNA-binding NtrC family response regulator